MINKTILKQILASNQKDVEQYRIVPRELPSDDFPRRVFVGFVGQESPLCFTKRCNYFFLKDKAGTRCCI